MRFLGGSRALERALPAWAAAAATFGALALTLWLERRRPLRRRTEPGPRREARNLAMAVASAVAIRAVEKPLASRLAETVGRRRIGLVKLVELPPAVEVALSVVGLDYTLYLWHVLTHRVPFLWRLHRVHHADLDLTASTALRFHFAEMAISVPWRLAQIAVVGASPLSLSLWQTTTLVAILFHHSNVRLPLALERRLCRLMMTPRMHGIHHSIVAAERDSNWSTIFSFPDYLHGTAKLDVPQSAVTIGIAGWREPRDLDFPHLLTLPLRDEPQRSAAVAGPAMSTSR